MSTPDDKKLVNDQKLGEPVATADSASPPPLAPMPEEALGLAGESVDFNSVLSAVSGNGTYETPNDLASRALPAQKDRNLSSVIARIQDEGPAIADDVLAPGKDDSAASATKSSAAPAIVKPVEESLKRKNPQPKRPASHRQRTVQAERQAGVAQESAAAPPSIGFSLANVLVPVLVVCLLGMGYLLYQEEMRNEGLQSELARVNEKLDKLDGRVVVVDQQLLQQRKQMMEWVTTGQLESRLQAHYGMLEAKLEAELQLLRPSPADTVANPEIRPPSTPVPVEENDQPVMMNSQRAQVATEHSAKKDSPEIAGQSASKDKAEVVQKKPAGKTERSGKWVVHLVSHGNRAQAENALEWIQKAAPEASIRGAKVKGRQVYRVSVLGLDSKQEALAYRKRISQQLNLKGAWIARN